MDGFAFNTKIGGSGGGSTPQGTDDPLCGGNNIGTMVGKSIANFKLQNCNGEWINLHKECGSKAVHIFGTAGWCPSCSTALNTLAGSLGGQITPASIEAKWPGVKMWVVLSEDPGGSPPSLQYCKAYAQDKKIDPSIMFIDNNPAGVPVPLVEPQGYAVNLTGFATTYTHINPYLKAEGDSVSMGVPWSAVLKGKEMEYYWSDYYDMSKNWNIALQEVLAAP